jgi:enoyl-CoA hydratase/carnithine racemase
MRGDRHLEGSYGFFHTKRLGEVIILSLRNNVFNNMTDLVNRDVFLKYLDWVSECDAVKAIVINSPLQKCGTDEYLEFFLDSGHENDSTPFWMAGDRERRNEIARLCNVVNQVILKIVGLKKIVIHACQGNVVSLFLNLSLACDYRIVADNTVFSNAYLEIGMLPKGGGPFFLSRMVGPVKAYEILLLHKDISAHEAMRYGIVDEIVPLEKLEEAALEIAHRFGQIHPRSLSGMKRLVNYSTRDLEEYLKIENQEILGIIDSRDFERSRSHKDEMGMEQKEEYAAGTVY